MPEFQPEHKRTEDTAPAHIMDRGCFITSFFLSEIPRRNRIAVLPQPLPFCLGLFLSSDIDRIVIEIRIMPGHSG